jgi:hypothetical protein
MPCGIKEIPVKFENRSRFVLKKLDKPLSKNPIPPILTARAQKMLLLRRDPSI